MWESVKLSEIVTFVRGLTYSKKDEVNANGLAVLRATNVSLEHHKITLDEIRYIKTPVKLNEDKLVKVGDILMCTASGSKSHLGKCALVKEDLGMAFGGFMAALRCKSSCLPEYLFYILTSNLFMKRLSSLSDGANINNLKFSQIEDFEFPLPSLAEQERIVAKLDAAFAEIERAVKNANSKEFEINKLQASLLSASLSTNAIKSELTSIIELCNAIYAGGDAPAKVNISKVKTKKYKTPIYSNGVKDSGLYGYTTSEPRTFQPAITISARGTIGHIELRNKPFLPIVRLIVLEPKIEKIDLAFLKYALLNMKIFSSGSSIPQLTVPMLKKMNLSLPPLAKQKQIVKKMDTAYREFENAYNLIEKSRQSYKSLKSAILAQELQSSEAA